MSEKADRNGVELDHKRSQEIEEPDPEKTAPVRRPAGPASEQGPQGNGERDIDGELQSVESLEYARHTAQLGDVVDAQRHHRNQEHGGDQQEASAARSERPGSAGW